MIILYNDTKKTFFYTLHTGKNKEQTYDLVLDEEKNEE